MEENKTNINSVNDSNIIDVEPIITENIKTSNEEKTIEETILKEPVIEEVVINTINDHPTKVNPPIIRKERKRHPVLYAMLIAVIVFTFSFAGNSLSNRMYPSQSVIYQSMNQTAMPTMTNGNLSIQQIAERNLPSVVEIKAKISSQGFLESSTITTGVGSGVIITADGYIVTNNHVVKNIPTIIVKLHNGDEHEATVVGVDSKTDLAVLKIDYDNLVPVTLGDSDKILVGDSAIAIGNPLGAFGGSVTDGIISGLNRSVTVQNRTMSLLQTSAQVSPGNSGGGLFDGNGDLIGIVVAKSIGSSVEGIGFAIPVNVANEIITQIIEHGYVADRPTIGVYIQEIPYGSDLKAGIYITGIIEGSAASEIDLLVGDRIVAVDQTEISTFNELDEILGTKKIGDTINIQVVRDSKIMSVECTLKGSVQLEE